MSQERREILQMLTEGKLTVADAERLLDALTAGERKRSRPDEGRKRRERGRRKKRSDRYGIEPIVDRAVVKALRRAGMAGGGTEAIDASEGRFPVEEGAALLLRNNPRHPGGGSITVSRAKGEECEVDFEGPFRVVQAAEGVCIEWDYGDIEVAVPDAVASVSAETLGGNIVVTDLRSPMKVLTAGGDLRISGMCSAVEASTQGGNVWFDAESLDPDSASQVATLGGDMFASFGPEFQGVVKAQATSGEIQVEEELGRVFDAGGGNMPRAVTVEVGEKPRIAEITLTTLTGNVFLEKRS